METNRWCIPIFEDPTQSIDITEKNLKVQISFLFHCYHNAYYSRFHVTFDSAICKQFFNYQLLGACCIKEALAEPSDNVEELKVIFKYIQKLTSVSKKYMRKFYKKQLDLKNYRFLKDLMKTVKEEDAFKNILDFYEKKVLNINKKNLEIIGERSDKVFSNWKKKLLKFYNDCHAPTPTKETTATTTNPISQSSATENELENETTTPAENTDIIVPAQPTASTARRFSEETTIIEHRQQSGIETVTPQLFESGEEYFQEQEMAISALQSELEPLTTEIESAQPTTGLESAPQSTGIEPAPPTTGLESELPSTNCENIEEMDMEIYNQMGLGENLEVGEMMQLDEDVQNDDAVSRQDFFFNELQRKNERKYKFQNMLIIQRTINTFNDPDFSQKTQQNFLKKTKPFHDILSDYTILTNDFLKLENGKFLKAKNMLKIDKSFQVFSIENLTIQDVFCIIKGWNLRTTNILIYSKIFL
ncbi:unnamed protein product [Dimorphilus gyrociliatus]|uniref:Uncharacterized protein n=1 Tax=Dimorphilus gyrociliatus TaxID=2664684 RepID=A0A7I8WE35_9ANNE|nr:unnamed protein product [Dimorphilus gyrociliatus]